MSDAAEATRVFFLFLHFISSSRRPLTILCGLARVSRSNERRERPVRCEAEAESGRAAALERADQRAAVRDLAGGILPGARGFDKHARGEAPPNIAEGRGRAALHRHRRTPCGLRGSSRRRGSAAPAAAGAIEVATAAAARDGVTLVIAWVAVACGG